MAIVDRDILNIVFKIQYIVDFYCKDEILKLHWLNNLSDYLKWHHDYDKNLYTIHWNLAPEVILNTKWKLLNALINSNIKENSI